MFEQLRKFWKLASVGSLRLALVRTIEYVRRHVYGRINVSSFIQSKLLVGGPATPLHALYVLVFRLFFNRESENEVAVMDEDWDNLILLDSYRADYFREHSSLEGELSTAISKGTWSLEFVVNNFQNSNFYDTIVVTSNPYYQRYSKLDEDAFYSVVYCSKTEGIESFDEITERAMDVHDENPNKRLIIHYMKPHAPHVGATSDRLREKFGDVYPGIFMLYRTGVISKQTLEQSYIDTIEAIEPKVQELLDELDGKSVVSADHGENLGETRHGLTQVGHGNPTPECYRVPWLETEYTERRRVTEDAPVESTQVDEEVIEENLRALGYK